MSCRNIEWRIPPYTLIFWALMLMILPLRWILGISAAAFFHEISHIAVIRLCNGDICGISLGPMGARIDLIPLSPFKEFLCAAAGPAASILLALLAWNFPVLALGGMIQGVYNLLPLYPNDGGRMLHSLCHILFPRAARYVISIAEALTAILVLTFGMLSVTILHLPVFFVCFWILVILRPLAAKIPCKGGPLAVQ